MQNSAGVQVGDHNTQSGNFGTVSAGGNVYLAGNDMTVHRP